MRVLILIIALTLSAVSGAFTETPTGTRACAHRGDMKNAPENTLPAFQSAVQKGAHMIEFDVQRTSDGHLVIMHDATVDRTTDGSGRVKMLTLAEIRSLDAGAWFSPAFAGTRVPTLQETLAIIPETILCNVHLKDDDPSLGRDTALAIAAMGRQSHCFLACTQEQARMAREAVPEIRICNMGRYWTDRDAYIASTIEMGAEFIQLHWGQGMEGLAEDIRTLRQAGISVNWYGASEETLIRNLVKAGVDFILTRDLDLCLRVLAEYGVPPLSVRATQNSR